VTEKHKAVRRMEGRKQRKKLAERRKELAKASFARQEKIFEYDYTARVNRLVRKRAASYTRNAFACPRWWESRRPMIRHDAGKGDFRCEEGTMGIEVPDRAPTVSPLRAKGELAINRAISHHP